MKIPGNVTLKFGKKKLLLSRQVLGLSLFLLTFIVLAQSPIEVVRWQVGQGEHKPALLRLDQVRAVLEPKGVKIGDTRLDHFPAFEIVLPDGKNFYAQRIAIGTREFIPLEDLIINTVEQGYDGKLEGWSPLRLQVGVMDLQLGRLDPYIAYAYLLSKSVLGHTEYRWPLNPTAPKRCLHILKVPEAANTVLAVITRKGLSLVGNPEFDGEAFDIAGVEQNKQVRFRLIESELSFAGSLDELRDPNTQANAVLVRFGNTLSAKGIDFEVVKGVATSKSTQCR